MHAHRQKRDFLRRFPVKYLLLFRCPDDRASGIAHTPPDFPVTDKEAPRLCGRKQSVQTSRCQTNRVRCPNKERVLRHWRTSKGLSDTFSPASLTKMYFSAFPAQSSPHPALPGSGQNKPRRHLRVQPGKSCQSLYHKPNLPAEYILL